MVQIYEKYQICLYSINKENFFEMNFGRNNKNCEKVKFQSFY